MTVLALNTAHKYKFKNLLEYLLDMFQMVYPVRMSHCWTQEDIIIIIHITGNTSVGDLATTTHDAAVAADQIY